MDIENKSKAAITYQIRKDLKTVWEGTLQPGHSIGQPLPDRDKSYSLFLGVPCVPGTANWAEYPEVRDDQKVIIRDVMVKCDLLMDRA